MTNSTNASARAGGAESIKLTAPAGVKKPLWKRTLIMTVTLFFALLAGGLYQIATRPSKATISTTVIDGPDLGHGEILNGPPSSTGAAHCDNMKSRTAWFLLEPCFLKEFSAKSRR